MMSTVNGRRITTLLRIFPDANFPCPLGSRTEGSFMVEMKSAAEGLLEPAYYIHILSCSCVVGVKDKNLVESATKCAL